MDTWKFAGRELPMNKGVEARKCIVSFSDLELYTLRNTTFLTLLLAQYLNIPFASLCDQI